MTYHYVLNRFHELDHRGLAEYLDQMSAKGWQLVYWQSMMLIFEQTEPKEQQHRIILSEGAAGLQEEKQWLEAGWQRLPVGVALHKLTELVILCGALNLTAPFDWHETARRLAESRMMERYKNNLLLQFVIVVAIVAFFVLMFWPAFPYQVYQEDRLVQAVLLVGVSALMGMVALEIGLQWLICRRLEQPVKAGGYPGKWGKWLVVGEQVIVAAWLVGLVVLWLRQMFVYGRIGDSYTVFIVVTLCMQLIQAVYHCCKGERFKKAEAGIWGILLAITLAVMATAAYMVSGRVI